MFFHVLDWGSYFFGYAALEAVYIMSSCGFSRRRVSVLLLAVVVVIRTAGRVLRDVLQVVRRWVGWENVIDREWAQQWALQRLWLAEIGRQLFVSAFF